MDADFSIELGHDDPILDFPWTDPDGKCAYYDLRQHPELLDRLEEARAFPEMGECLHALNSRPSAVESAKCDVWTTQEMAPEEEIFGATSKSACYVDIVFTSADWRRSFPFQELFARRLVELLRKSPETPSAVEVCVRRCYFGAEEAVQEGFYLTLFVSGYGDDPARARQNWGIALKLTTNAILQLSVSGVA